MPLPDIAYATHRAAAPRSRIELVYDPTCPNVDHARRAIHDALTRIAAPPLWHEWDRTDPTTPVALQLLGSPTVLVDGRDVARAEDWPVAGDANSCRIYRDDVGRISGAPSARQILDAIAASDPSRGATEKTA